MKSRMVIGGLLVAGLLAGCGTAAPTSQQPASSPGGTTAVAQATTTTSGEATTAPAAPTAIPTAPTTTSAPDQTGTTSPEDVVRAFLTALKDDPSGKQSVTYLSSELVTQVASGTPLAAILGVQNIYQAFEVQAAETTGGAGSATVQATLKYTGMPIERVFTLTQESGAWRIAEIADAQASTPNSGPNVGGGGLNTRQVQIVRDYFAALASNRAADAWALLSPELQSQSSQATLESEEQGIESISVKTIEPVQVAEDRAVFHVVIAVTPKPGATTAWNAGDNERWIELQFSPQGWHITQFASSPLSDTGAPTA